MVEAARKGGSRKALELPVSQPLGAEEGRGILASVLKALLEGALDAGTARADSYLLQVERKIAEGDALERRKMLNAMQQEEGRRYNAYLDRYYLLREMLEVQRVLIHQATKDLLERDRILWYLYALETFMDRLTGAESILEDNPNLKPGRPIVFRLPFAILRLGVWGRKRYPFPPGKGPLIDVSEKVLEGLDIYTRRIRETVADIKAILTHLLEEARAMGLEHMKGIALGDVETIRNHDGEGAIIPGLLDSVAVLIGEAKLVRREDGFQDLESPWALVWEDIEANRETLRRVRESKDGHFIPASLDRAMKMLQPKFLEDLRK